MKVRETAPSALEQQLALTRVAYTPSSALRDRVLTRLELAPAPSPTRGESPVGRAARGRAAVGALVGAGLLALGFAGGYHASALREAPPLPPTRFAATPELQEGAPLLPEPEPLAEPEPLEPAAQSPLDAHASNPRSPRRARASTRRPAASPVTVAPPPAAPPPAAPPSSREELALLQRAERATRADNSALALALIAELEERYPRSELLEERKAIELIALCAAGATDGSARAEHFIRNHPRSVYAGRIAELCRSIAP
jgi:hypothetical protein